MDPMNQMALVDAALRSLDTIAQALVALASPDVELRIRMVEGQMALSIQPVVGPTINLPPKAPAYQPDQYEYDRAAEARTLRGDSVQSTASVLNRALAAEPVQASSAGGDGLLSYDISVQPNGVRCAVIQVPGMDADNVVKLYWLEPNQWQVAVAKPEWTPGGGDMLVFDSRYYDDEKDQD